MTAIVSMVLLTDSNNAGYIGTNAKSFWDAWTAWHIDMGLQSYRNNVAGGPQSTQSSFIEIKPSTPGINPSNGYVEAPWHPSRPGGRRWFGNMRTNVGGLGQQPLHDCVSILPTTADWCGFLVDRTSTGEFWETNKTRANIVYSIRGGNPDLSVTMAGAPIGADGTSYPGFVSPNLLHSPFFLELVDVTGELEADYGTKAAYSSQIINPVIGASSWPGVMHGFRSPWSGTITDAKKTLVRIRAYQYSTMKLSNPAGTSLTLEYNGSTQVVASPSTGTIQTALNTLASGHFSVSNIGTNIWVINSTVTRYGGGGALIPVTITAGTATCIDNSGACAFTGIGLADSATAGFWMHGLESSGGRESEMSVRVHNADGTPHATNGVSPGMYQQAFGLYASRIGMFFENSYGQAEHPNNATYATASHTAMGLDILTIVLTINSMANGITPAFFKAKYLDVVSRLDARTGSDETVVIIHFPPCIEGALSGTRDEYFTRTDGFNVNDFRAALMEVQAAYPATVIVVDHQARYGNVAPSVMKARYGKGGYGRTGTTNQTDPLHFGNDQYAIKVADVTVDLCMRECYLAA